MLTYIHTYMQVCTACALGRFARSWFHLRYSTDCVSPRCLIETHIHTHTHTHTKCVKMSYIQHIFARTPRQSHTHTHTHTRNTCKAYTFNTYLHLQQKIMTSAHLLLHYVGWRLHTSIQCLSHTKSTHRKLTVQLPATSSAQHSTGKSSPYTYTDRFWPAQHNLCSRACPFRRTGYPADPYRTDLITRHS